MSEYVENLIRLFNEDGVSASTGEEIFRNIDLGYNVFGSYAKISDSIYSGLTSEGKKRFETIFTLSCIELAHEWMLRGCNDWDDRKRHSEVFAYNNLRDLQTWFESYTGIKTSFPDEENKGFTRFIRKAIYDSKGNNGDGEYEWLVSYGQKFVSLHSTLKQSYIGGVVNGVILESNPKDGLVGQFKDRMVGNSDNTADIVFPFI